MQEFVVEVQSSGRYLHQTSFSDRVTGLHNGLDPRFVIVMTSCLQGKNVADHRQECLFEDLLEDFDDGSLCALSLRSDRNFDSVPAIPSQEEFAYLKQDKSKLPTTEVCDVFPDPNPE